MKQHKRLPFFLIMIVEKISTLEIVVCNSIQQVVYVGGMWVKGEWNLVL
jgi:hypothetical protein